MDSNLISIQPPSPKQHSTQSTHIQHQSGSSRPQCGPHTQQILPKFEQPIIFQIGSADRDGLNLRALAKAGSCPSAILLPYFRYTSQQKQQAILIWKMIKEGLSTIRCSAISRASCGQLRYSSARGTVYEASRKRLLEKLKCNVRTFSKLVSRQRDSVRQSSKRQTSTGRNSEPKSHRTLKLQGSPCSTLAIIKDHGNVDHFFLKVSLLRNQPRPPSSTHQLKHLLQKKPMRLLRLRPAENPAAPKACSKETPYRSVENSLMVIQQNHLRRASLQSKPPEASLSDSTISPWGISSDRE